MMLSLMSLWNKCNSHSWSVWILTLAIVLQPCAALAAPNRQVQQAPLSAAASNRVADIALKRGGILQGQMVNNAGVGMAGATAELTSGRQHWQAKTDAQGWFQIAGLRGGTYQFRAAGHSQVLRVWTAGTAPPSARQGVLVTPLTEVVRGQRFVSPNTNQFFRVAKQRLANPLVVGGIVATAVAIPVAIHNADDDDPPATP